METTPWAVTAPTFPAARRDSLAEFRTAELSDRAQLALTRAGRRTLSRLVAACTDSLAAFADAVAAIDDPELRGTLAEVARTRAALRHRLATALSSSGGRPPREGTPRGRARRLAAVARRRFSGDDPVVLLLNLERSEKRVRDRFAAALRAKTHPGTEEIVGAAMRDVLRVHDLVFSIKERAKAAA